MKHQYTKFLLISAALALSSSAQAGSILVLAPSTSKIEVIGTKKKVAPAIEAPAKEVPQKPAAITEPIEPVAKTTGKKPVLVMNKTQLRASDVELPVVQASGSSMDMKADK